MMNPEHITCKTCSAKNPPNSPRCWECKRVLKTQNLVTSTNSLASEQSLRGSEDHSKIPSEDASGYRTESTVKLSPEVVPPHSSPLFQRVSKFQGVSRLIKREKKWIILIAIIIVLSIFVPQIIKRFSSQSTIPPNVPTSI